MECVPQRTMRANSSAPTNSRTGSTTHLLVAQVQKLVKLDTAVRERAERPLLLEVGSDLRVGNGGISLQTRQKFVRSAIHSPSTTGDTVYGQHSPSCGCRGRSCGGIGRGDNSCLTLRRRLKAWAVAERLWKGVGTLLYSSQPPARARAHSRRSRRGSSISSSDRIHRSSLSGLKGVWLLVVVRNGRVDWEHGELTFGRVVQ